MTVQRKPLQTFIPFPKLPLEVQAEIWRYALSIPRIIELEGNGVIEHEGCTVVNCCVPSLLHVSLASRKIALQHLTTLWEKQSPGLAYYNQELDTNLPARREKNYLDCPYPGVRSIGLVDDCEGIQSFTGRRGESCGAQEVVIVAGRRPTTWWMSLHRPVDLLEYPYGTPDADLCGAWYFMDDLKTGMGKVVKKTKKWKGTLPDVQMARVEIVCHTVSPYRYDRIWNEWGVS